MAAPEFVDAAQASVHAVVHVQTASVVADRSNPWLSMLGLAEGRLAQGSGSGVIVDEEGLVVTNHHVIQGARTILVNTSDGMRYEASLVGSDPSTDLALLRILADKPLPSLPYGDSDETRVGEWVLAVGNPLNLTSTVTAGIVSAKGRNIRLLEGDVANNVFPVESFIQTDAAVNPGNSGGPLVNTKGELIGINTAIASQTGSYAGYSFAILLQLSKKSCATCVNLASFNVRFWAFNSTPFRKDCALPRCVLGAVRRKLATRGGRHRAHQWPPGPNVSRTAGTPFEAPSRRPIDVGRHPGRKTQDIC